MKVYVLLEKEPEDSSLFQDFPVVIQGVFATRESAERAMQALWGDDSDCGDDSDVTYEIEEHEVQS